MVTSARAADRDAPADLRCAAPNGSAAIGRWMDESRIWELHKVPLPAEGLSGSVFGSGLSMDPGMILSERVAIWQSAQAFIMLHRKLTTSDRCQSSSDARNQRPGAVAGAGSQVSR
jgi:hypothetical protein